MTDECPDCGGDDWTNDYRIGMKRCDICYTRVGPGWTEEDVKALDELRDSFEGRAREVAREYARITGFIDRWDPEALNSYVLEHWDSGTICFGRTYYYASNDSRHFKVEFPTRYLWQEGWQQELIAELAERDRQARLKAAAEEARRRAFEEAAERANYERLKAKYEGGEGSASSG